ncbi:Uncharacterised protein [Brucella melitensis]|nr:Uncharacterised protein [Brucella melitensis]
MHRLAGNKDIEFIRVEHEFMGTAIIKRLPEVEHIMGCALVHIDDAGVVLAAIADQPVLAAGKIDRERNAAAGNIGISDATSVSALWSTPSSLSSSCARPLRKRICDRREPVRTTMGKVRGLTSR